MFEPVGWRCKTPHGYVIGKTQHASSDEAVYSQEAIDTLRAQLEAAELRDAQMQDAFRLMQARAEAAEAEINWIKAQPEDDRMFAEIEAAAKASYQRHRAKVRGQVVTRSDDYESHVIWAALEWAARTKEQQA